MSFEGSFFFFFFAGRAGYAMLPARRPPQGFWIPHDEKNKMILTPMFDYLKWFCCFNFLSVLMTQRSGKRSILGTMSDIHGNRYWMNISNLRGRGKNELKKPKKKGRGWRQNIWLWYGGRKHREVWGWGGGG